MNKFAVCSGFLGAGKTTTMMALTNWHTAHRGKAAMISNDLGGQGLADDRFARLAGCNASELTDECICYQRGNLLARLNELFADGCELVLSDIPWAETLKVVAVRLVIMLALRFAFLGLVKLLWPAAELTQAVNVMFILPPPFVLPVFADDADQRVYVSSALSVSTLVAIVGFGVLALAG